MIGLAGGSLDKSKPLDGSNVWTTISAGQPSPRTEVVYNVEPFRAAVRQGDWKLVWRVTLPRRVELYSIAEDPSETHNIAAEHPELTATLQKRADELSAQGVQPTLLDMAFKSVLKQVHAPAALPGEEFELNEEN